MVSKIAATVVLLVLMFVHSFAIAARPQNELPMYGGERLPFEKRWRNESADELEDYKRRAQEVSQLGWKYFNEGLLDTAIKRFNQAWLFDPNNFQVWWGFGVIMGNRGKNENNDKYFLDSIKYLEKAITLSDDNYRIMIDLATAYTNFGVLKLESNMPNTKKTFTDALHWSLEAERINSVDPVLWINRAYMQVILGQFHDAIKTYFKVIELAPGFVGAYNDLAWFLATCPNAKYRDGNKALDIAQKAMHLMPDNSAIYDTLAAAYAEKGEFESAITTIEKAILLQKKENKTSLLEIFDSRLKLYRQLKPYREHSYSLESNRGGENGANAGGPQ